MSEEICAKLLTVPTKLKSKKWKSLISGVLLAASASSFLIAPVYAADYSKPLIGTLKKDSEILSPDGNTVTENDGKLIYDFQGKDHTFTITNKDGITARKDSVYNNVGADGSYGTLHIYQTNDKSNAWDGVNGFTANNGTIVVNSNLDITATSEYSSVGIAAANKGNLIINGNVKMRKDDAENPWGIITKNVHGNIGPGGATSMGGDANYTGARWQPAGISVDYTRGDVTVNGNVDLAVRGTAVRTDAYQADGDVPAYDLGTISLLGNSIRIDTPYREENFVEGFGKFIEPYYALASYGGTINVNVKNQEAQNGKVEMVGNVLAMKSSDEAGKDMVYQNGRLNIGLTTQDSSWKGVIDNAGTAKAGEVNLWLQNGAQWIYENASRKDGLDASNLPDYSRPYYEKYDGMSHLSRLVGGKDSASAGIIRVNDNDPIHIANAEGVTKVWYEHDDATPGNIIGGDVKVLNAKAGTEMMLYTGNNGISKGFAEGDTAAEKNNVSEVLNSLAHKLWYMAGNSNLTGSVSIAEGLTASSLTMKTGNITFAEGGQGFYYYTPEKDDKTYATGPIVKSENIGETRESDINGVVSVNVTEAQDGVSGNAPSAMYAAGEAEGPLVVDLQGHTLKLNANNQTANYVSTVYVDADKSMEIKDSKGNGVLKVSAGLGADGNADTKAKYVYGIRVGEGGNLTANTDVEIDGVKSSATQRAYGVYVSTKGNVVFEKDLTIKNVQTGNKVGPNTAGIYADSSSSADAPINITVKGNLNIENVLGSAIRALNTSTISTAGATIKAADMSNGTDYSQYYALQANKGTINLNTGEGITAGILDVTGDMKVTDNKASVINVNMTKGSQWTGAVSNIPGSTYNAPAGQFNLTMADGSVWNHETGRSVDTLKTTFAGSNVSKLDGSGVIYQNSDKGITVYDYRGDTTVVYGHDAENPLNITGGNFTVKTAAEGSKITLVTDSQGINAGFEAADTAAEKNNVKEVLNKLANKLFYTGYKDANLAGVVKIADGLTASSVSAIVKAYGDVAFSDGSNGTKKAGQGFYDYTPEEDKPDYKTGAITKSENISLNREVDDKGVAHINVTESNAGNNKFASAIYAGEETSPSKPMTVNMSGKGLALNVAQTGGQAAAIYAGANTYIKVINPSAEQKLSITANNTDTRGSHGVYADGNAHLNISGPVEITDIVTKGDSATGINIQGQKSEINIDGPLTISNVKGIRERGAGMNASGIQVTGDTSTVTVSGPVDISSVRGSGIRLTGKDTKVSVGGGTITAAEDSDKSHNFYAVRVDKGTLDINMKDGAAGDTTTKITGDMYATGQYGKKVVEYSGGELIDWKDAGILNVALTDKDSFWKGVAAYDQYNSDYGSGGNTTHDIGQFNLYLQNGAAWTNEQQSHVTTTTIASKNPVWAGSTLATLHGGKDADNAGLIYQKDNNPISVVNYSGHTTVFYDHDAADPTKIIGGSFNITNAAEGSAITFITDNKGITSGFADGDSADAKDKVANVLNALAGKLTYSNFASGENNLNGSVKIAAGLTASDKIMKVDTIKFNKDTGKGYTKEETVNPGGGEKTTFTDAITGEKQGVFSAVQQEDLSYVFTEDASVTVNQMTHKEADPDWAGSFIISGAAVQNAAGVENLVIKAEDKTLKLKVALDDKTVPPDKNAGILNNRIPLRGIDNSIAGSTTSVTAGTLDINVDNTYSRKTSSGNPMIGECDAIGIYAKSAGEKAVVEVTGNTAIKAHGYNNVYGVNANGNAEIKLHGDLTMAKDGEDWAIDNVIKGQNTTTLVESSWRIIAGINANGAGANVTVDGKTTIAAHGSGVVAADGATVNLGAADIEIKNNSSEYGYGFHALGAALGTVNVGGEGKTVTVKGNAGIFGEQGQKFVSDSKESVINLKLTDAESAWTGVAYKKFTDAEKEAGLSGSMNLTVANGASWNNEKYGYVYGDSEWEEYKFTGSEIADFVGGASEAKAGNIFQKDTNSLTIDNYSGNTNIFYAHTGNGEAAENYAAGDTIIKHAEKDSVVSLITDNTGIAMDSEDSVANVLNTLASKLTYSNFVNGEKNLTGLVKIADGLTASSTALKTGNIAFSTEDGKGSLNKEDVKPEPPTPPTPTYPEDQKADKFDQGISGNDEKYKDEGVLKEDGSYVFTKNPTAIEVKDGAAVGATNKDIVIDTTKAKLVLKGETGIKADGADVNVKGSTDISGKVGIDAVNGNVTINGSTVINGTDAAINAGEGANVDINTNNSALNIKGDINANGGNITVDSGKATGTIESNVTASNGGNVEISLNDKKSTLTGAYNVDADSSIVMNIANGSTWNLTDDEDEASGMSLMRMAKAPAATAKGLTLNGGKTEAETGFINLQKRTKDVKIANYSGWETFIYSHEGAGDKVSDYKSGDTVIAKADKGSGVILSTDGSGITMTDKKAVEATLKALAQKVTYKDHAANGENLSGKVQIAEGLISSSVSKNLGTIHWDENGKGQYDLDSVNWSQIIEGDYETFVMKGVRSAATTSLHTWRDNMQDTYTGADMADEDGMFAKALGGKTSSDVKGLKDSNTYYGVQVGYDKAAANGWHTGVAFDYRNGDSNYLLGGKGDNQMYSLGVYGVKNFENDAFFRVAAKVGRVENEYDVYNEIRSLKLNGDYKANAYGLTMEYGKTFGDEEAYFTPKAQLTWSQVGAKDYTAHTDNATMQISQDSYSSFVGRLGFEAGVKSEKGRVYAGLFAAHEFNGDISASYFANDGDRKHTSFNGEETWMEMKLGGTYDFSNNAHLYADIDKDFNGNFERKWKMNVGLRFEF